MFDLEQAISEWHAQMLAAGIKTPVPLEELESHLREDIERQMKSGLNGQKAFEIATGRLGQANPLKVEFKKINSLDKAQQRKREGFIFAAVLGFYSLAMACLLFINKYDLTFNERLSGFASLATTLASVFVACRILPRFFPVIANKTAKSAIGIVGGISGMSWFLVFAWYILPRCDFTMGQLQVAVLWAIVPVMVFPTISFLMIDKSESRRATP
jgi:hypothetical protein